jgi:hypothetical protein
VNVLEHRDEIAALMQGHDLPTVAEVLASYLRRPAWTEQARCKGRTGIMHGTSSTAERDALALCQTCPVIDPCRKHALDTDERHGTWGGLTAAQRSRLRRATA